MDDGSKANKGLKFATNSFSHQDCLKLTAVLKKNFGLKASVHSAGSENQFVIYI